MLGSVECTRQSDCAPYVCCDYKGVSTVCQDGCEGPFDARVCRTIADCRPRRGEDGKMRPPRACAPEGSEMLPGTGIKTCRYD